jgi:hypothetical protein
VSAAERAKVLRELLRDAEACRILLRDREVETIRDAMDLYEDQAAGVEAGAGA